MFISFNKIKSNEKINNKKLEKAKEIISKLQEDAISYIEQDYGPFVAAIFDTKGNLIAKEANTVNKDFCSNNHAEINTIRAAQCYLKTYDLSNHNLSIYITSEPCMMCIGAIMWSGIKEVYYGVPSRRVEEITGFDEGFKPNWFKEFKKRNIIVYGNIEVEQGEKVLKQYVKSGKKIYMPDR